MISQINDGLVTIALAMMRPLGLTLLFPLLQIGSLGSSLIRNAILLAITFPMLPIIYAQPIVHQGWGWISFIPGEMILVCC